LPAALDAAARTYACREGQVVIPTEARAPDGLPLPGALALGVQAEQLPMLRGLTARPLPFQRRLLGDARLPTGGTALVYELGGATAVVITSPPIDPGGQPGADAPIVVGARVVVPGGLTTEQARAWLAAMAPCRPLPALDDETGTFYNGLWRRPNDVPAVEPKHGYFADALELNASTVDDDAWRQAGEFITRDLFTPNAPLPILPTAGPVPACRWVGVQAFGLIYGK